MADAQSSAGVAVRACKACGKTLPNYRLRARKYFCSNTKCDPAQARYRLLKGKEANKRSSRAKLSRRRSDATYRDAVNEAKRRWRAEKRERGLTDRNTPVVVRDFRNSRADQLAVQNARQAWTYWIRVKAPDWWMRDYYRAMGRPWANPRLTDAQQWKIRYWCDPAFRAKEIEKVQVLKERRAQRIAATCDGTLSGEVIVALFAAAKDCYYCAEVMRSVDKSLDHKIPLSAGGAHSITNVVVCCKTCNTLKGKQSIDEWIASMMRAQASEIKIVRVLPDAA